MEVGEKICLFGESVLILNPVCRLVCERVLGQKIGLWLKV